MLSLAGSLATAARNAATATATTTSSNMLRAAAPHGIGSGGMEAMQRRWMGGSPAPGGSWISRGRGRGWSQDLVTREGVRSRR